MKFVIFSILLVILGMDMANSYYIGLLRWPFLNKLDPLQAESTNFVPMVHNNNYDMIMPDYYDHHPAASMPLQNFEKFYNVEGAANAELKMDESQFLKVLPYRPPQPLSSEERRIREKLEFADEKYEKKVQLKLKKGTTKPRGRKADQWDQFDYDMLSSNPGNKREYVRG